MPQIQDFYSNQTIFLTGVTGFLGKLIAEKLLYSCPNVRKIFVLVRPKKTQSAQARLQEIINSPCFDRVRDSKLLAKIVVVNGDCGEINLGLSSNDLAILRNEVTCVIHSAANTRFDTGLKNAVNVNSRSVRDILILASEILNLKAFVYVSTAFSHCYTDYIEEVIYEGQDPDEILKSLNDLGDVVSNETDKKFLGKWPNSYVFSKAVAESFVQKYGKNLPITIVRPAIVVSAFEEPIKGWIDNFHGIVGVSTGISLGIVRTLQINRDCKAPLVPADYVVNIIIAAAWNIASNPKGTPKTPIFNFAPDSTNILDWNNVINKMESYRFSYATSKTLRYPYCQYTKFEIIQKLRIFFYHTVFAYLVDLILPVFGKKPIAVDKYNRINTLLNVLSFFSTHSWTFETKNVQVLWNKLDKNDRKVFKFNMKQLDWKQFFQNIVIGGRVHLLQDPLETIPAAKKKIILLCSLHWFITAFIYICWYIIILKILSFVF